MLSVSRPVGPLLRDWRQRRRLSQLDLALEADVSARHISFLETGRAKPSREMLLHLAEQLNIPLRERNDLLVAAGFAPVYPERGLESPALGAARQTIDLVLAGHEPNPALAVDRHWHLIVANRAAEPFFAGIPPMLLRPPINVLRATLHPDGLAKRIANLPEWRGHVFARVRRQIEVTADPALADLLEELRAFPVPSDPNGSQSPPHGSNEPDAVIPLRLRTDGGILSFLYTTTIFGTPADVTLAELAIETFFPADAATAAVLRGTVVASRQSAVGSRQ